MPTSKPRVLLAYNKEGTPFQRIAAQIRLRLSDIADFRLATVDALPNEEFDVSIGLSPGSLAASRFAVARAGIACVYDDFTWRTDPGLGMADVVVCGNRRLVEDVKRGGPIPRSVPILLCEDGVDTDMFDMPEAAGDLVGWAGSAQANKGGALFSAAARGIRSSMVVGATRCHSDMPAWYGTLAKFVCTSHREGTPNTILEALACGVEVVSTLVGVVPELIDQGANITVVRRDVDSIARAIRMPERMAFDSRTLMVAQWDWSHKIGAWRTAIEAALCAAGKPTRIARRPPPAPRGWVLRNPKPKVLCVADQREWAFDVNERAMAKYLASDFDFDFAYVEDGAPVFSGGYDAVFAPYHRWPRESVRGLFEAPVFGSCRSDRLDIERPEFVSDEDAEWVRSCSAFHACTRKSYEWLRGLFGKHVCYLTNPVDTDVFCGTPVCEYERIALWAGNPGHGNGADHKGVGMIRQACEWADIQLVEANYAERRLPHMAMPSFYSNGNIYICASAYEGASNSAMEAMASGCILVSTDVGNVREIRDSQIANMGDTGVFLCDRTPGAIEGVLLDLECLDDDRFVYLQKLNQIEIRERWSWKKWAPAYAAQLRRIACR